MNAAFTPKAADTGGASVTDICAESQPRRVARAARSGADQGGKLLGVDVGVVAIAVVEQDVGDLGVGR